MIWLALLSCGDPGVVDPPAVDVAAELTAPGPHRVGYREGEVSYDEPETGTSRTLRLAWWFPTDARDGDEVRYQGLFEAPGVLGGVGIAPGTFPVAVFSHGHQGYAENSSFLAVHLASHGWIVVAPDHTGNTTFDGPDRTNAIYHQRPRDVAAVLDALAADPIGASADPGRAIAIGHSFGGYTTYALAGATYAIDALAPACAAGTGPEPFCDGLTPEAEAIFRAGLGDARLAAVVAMASGDFDLFGADGVAAIERPVLHLTGGLDPGADNEPYWDANDGPDAIRAHLPAAGHQSFTDFAGILEDMDGLLDRDEGFRVIGAYVLAFARFHTGDASVGPVLDGSVAISDAVALSWAD